MALKRTLPAAKDAAELSNRNANVAVDKKTGLMWTMLDSFLAYRECLNYEDAQQYVKDLETGRYKDWRLPTENELVGIYKQKPFFPTRAITSWGLIVKEISLRTFFAVDG